VRRSILTILPAGALYGFSIGSVHSLRVATWNLAKFPLLFLATSVVCALAFFACTLPITRKLSFVEVMRTSLRTFADLSVLLASLAPVSYFLAKTVTQPTQASLNEYPFFLGLNVVFIAFGGTVALVRQALRLTKEHELRLAQSAAILFAWLAISLFTGGQCAWYMRPFFGPSTIVDPPFMEGTTPDFRGATSFYEAVYYVVAPPELPTNYFRAPRAR